MNLGLLGAVGGLGQGLAQTGNSLFDDLLEQKKEERLQAIRDKEYARGRADDLADIKTKRDFDLEDQANANEQKALDREAEIARSSAYGQDAVIELQRERQALMKDPEGNKQAIDELTARIDYLTSRGTNSSKYDSPLYTNEQIEKFAIDYVEKGLVETIDEGREVARSALTGGLMNEGQSNQSPDSDRDRTDPPVPGARKAPDGYWYVRGADGKWNRVVED